MKRVLPLIVVSVVLLTAISALAQRRVNGPNPMPRETVRVKPAPVARPNWWGPPPPPPNGPPKPNQGPRARGIVAAAGTNSITIRTPSGFNTYTIASNTEIIVRGNPGALADAAQGDVASVNFDFDMSSLTTPAKRIEITMRQPAGQITAIQGNIIKISDEFGTVWNVEVSPDTRIMCLRQPIALADLQIGYTARAEGQCQANDVQAKALQIQPAMFKGAVVEINANTIKLKTMKQEIIEGTLTDRTRVVIRPRVGPNLDGTRADIKKDMPANIAGLAHEGQPMDVLVVELLTGQ